VPEPPVRRFDSDANQLEHTRYQWMIAARTADEDAFARLPNPYTHIRAVGMDPDVSNLPLSFNALGLEMSDNLS
jgi:hypothetical protein